MKRLAWLVVVLSVLSPPVSAATLEVELINKAQGFLSDSFSAGELSDLALKESLEGILECTTAVKAAGIESKRKTAILGVLNIAEKLFKEERALRQLKTQAELGDERAASALKAAEKEKKDLARSPNLTESGIQVRISEYSERPEYQHPSQMPAKGLMHIGLLVEVENGSPNSISVNPMYFQIKDEEGVVYPAVRSYRFSPALQPSEVTPGDKVKGWLTYEVSSRADIEAMRLMYVAGRDKTGWIPVD